MKPVERFEIIDFFRGLAILEMMLVHFSRYFQPTAGRYISYLDVAIEGFLLLAGLMIGLHYYPRFLQDQAAVTKKLIAKTMQLVLVQYLLIFTINLPFYFLVYDNIRAEESLGVFLLKSMLFLNQLGLLHILPTFVPLLAVSPFILVVLKRRLELVLLFLSLGIFALGNRFPYASSLGEREIFPVVLWQIYFIFGCVLGKLAYTKQKIAPTWVGKLIPVALSLVAVFMFVKHAKVIPPTLTSKFPLNALGICYGSSILFLVYTIILRLWGQMVERCGRCLLFVIRFGRQSIGVFVLHVYSLKIIELLNVYNRQSKSVNCALCLLSVAFIYWLLIINQTVRAGRVAQPIPS